jgi:hypothetical protein
VINHAPIILGIVVSLAACSDSPEPPMSVPSCGRGLARECVPASNYERLAEDAIDVHRRWRHGGGDWSETLVDFSDRAYNERQRKACGATVGRGLDEACNYRVMLVVEGRNGLGAIVYSETRDLAEIREPKCVEYSDCIAAGYIGKSIRLPTRLEGVAALQFFVQALPQSAFGDDLQNPDFLRMDIEISREDYERLRQKDWQNDPRLRFVVPHLEDEIRYFERKLAELEE